MSEEKKGFFSRLKQGLTKTRNNIVHGMDSVFKGYSHIDEDFYEELEEVLIMGDIGVNATGEIMERLRKQVKEQRIKEPHECRELLIENIKEQMKVGETAYEFENTQSVILVIGVNGDDMMSSAAVYAPYMPVLPTQLLGYADGAMSQGFSTMYALEMLNKDLLVAGRITA